MKKAFITSMVISGIVIAALVIVIVYLLKKGQYSEHIVSGDIETTATDEALPDIEPSNIDDKDLDSIIDEGVTLHPDKWYGVYESSGPVEKAIDFDSYRSECPDIYAWIEVPGTDIDYPVAYCDDAENPFWFTHDMYGNPDEAGMIITDSLNGKDMSDPMTLIYGQNPDDDTMFAQLHALRDAEFFEDHDHVNIYMDDAQLVYRIYACYIDSADHIFADRDFRDPVAFGEYFESIGSVRDLSMNIRQEAKPSFNDHVIALITHCDDESKRLFVLAVLDEVRYGNYDR